MKINAVTGTCGSAVPAARTAQADAGSGSFASALKSAAAKISGEQTLEGAFERASQSYGVPENLLKAVAKAESGFRSDAVSSCGAQGVMQLMPSTAKSLGVSDSFDAEQNIMGGAKYLSSLLQKYGGDAKLAVAAYNAGSGNVDKYGGVPPFQETKNYVEKVLSYAGQDLTVPSGSAGEETGAGAVSAPESGSEIQAASFTEEDYGRLVQFLTQALLTRSMALSEQSEEEQQSEAENFLIQFS